jgi:predicted metalloendopeptidase
MRFGWLFLVLSCSKAPSAGSPNEASRGELTAAVDPAADPCVDFYAYACGGWAKSFELPADKAVYYRSFSSIDESNQKILKEILEEAAKDPAADPLGAYWKGCNDQDAIEAAGFAPLAPWRERIDQVQDLTGFANVAGALQRTGASPLAGGFVGADANDPDTYVLWLFQGGTALPERSYYLDDSAERVELRKKYQQHTAEVFRLLGVDEADRRASRVLEFETELAKIAWPIEDLRDSEKTNHRLDRAGLAALDKAFPWDAFFAGLGYPDLTAINVATPSYFEGLRPALERFGPEDWRAYLLWQLVVTRADDLPKALADAHFGFFGRTLSGQQEQEARWRRCAEQTDAALGERLGQAYVERAFAGSAKEEAVDMIRRVELAFEAGLPQLAWMDDATRARAVEKARAITNKVGFPDAWRSYEGLEIRAEDHFGNQLRQAEFNLRHELDKVGKKVDPAAWLMTPQTVNAYYNPSENEIVFPAGILQAPFFRSGANRALNYGAIGMVMGHEITHGFDDDGRKYSPTGQLTQWWEPSAVERFEEKAACVRDQYAGMEAQPGLFVNGQLTLGENIADLGGIALAYRAYQGWAAEQGPEPKVEGFTPEQQFFLSFAQGWCAVASPEIERVRLATDPHSPPRYRVNGPLMNFRAFAEAFQCKAGSPMAPEARCEVW